MSSSTSSSSRLDFMRFSGRSRNIEERSLRLVQKPCTSRAIMAIAPTMINIRRKSCIIIFSVVLTPCHHGKHLLTKSICPLPQVQVHTWLSLHKDEQNRAFCCFFEHFRTSQRRVNR